VATQDGQDLPMRVTQLVSFPSRFLNSLLLPPKPSSGSAFTKRQDIPHHRGRYDQGSLPGPGWQEEVWGDKRLGLAMEV